MSGTCSAARSSAPAPRRRCPHGRRAGRRARGPHSRRPRGTGPYGETAGDQLDLGAGAGERARRGRGRTVACRPPDRRFGRAWASILAVLLSYCVVNTNGREFLLACLEAIERTAPPDLEREVLVLDNASDDGSAEAVQALDRGIRLIALERRDGKARERQPPARGGARRVLPAAQRGLRAAAGGRARAARGAAARTVRRPWPARSCCRPTAGRCPAPGGCPASRTALAGALFLHRRFTVESGGDAHPPRRLGAVERDAGAP